jgi:germination protein M
MKKLSVFWLVLLLAACTGCMGKGKQSADSDESGVYHLYTVKDSKIVSEDYRTDTTDNDQLVRELLTQIGLSADEDKSSVYVESQSIHNQVVYLSFNNQYSSMDTVQEVLFRASVVRTIAQVPGISYVYFYVDGTSLAYEDGTLVGKMAASDFVNETNDDLNSLAWTTITLYFSNTTGDRLVEKDIEMAYSKTMSMERLVIEQLIAGPDDPDMKATLPSNLRVLSVSVKEGVCYLNLDGAFLNEIVDTSANVQIYSIVNSLTELSGISEVQIQVNGDSHNELRDISLEKNFVRNPDLIETKEDGVN